MSALELNRIGFAQPTGRERARTRWKSALTHLIAFAALIAAIGVAGAAVSIGMARADVVDAVTKGDGVPLAIALGIALLLAAMGGLTAIVAGNLRRD